MSKIEILVGELHRAWPTELHPPQGSEAGGHSRSTTGLFPLVPRMVDALNPTPVVAASGIADGRGMAAALCLGAAPFCVGTRLNLVAPNTH
jgi:NAD(P)H-dependent flavin oxidoreductase YrpB (nitropropane dioxygenase family)